MDYRSVFERAISHKLSEHTFSDNRTIMDNIAKRAEKMEKSRKTRERIFRVIGGIAATAAVIAAAFFGVNWLNEHGGLKERSVKIDEEAHSLTGAASTVTEDMTESERYAARFMNGLRWGMNEDEIKLVVSEYWQHEDAPRKFIPDDFISEESRSFVVSDAYSVLTYDNTDFFGTKAELDLTVFDIYGLSALGFNVKFDIDDNGEKKADELYNRVRSDIVEVFGENEKTNWWDVDSNLTIDVFKPDKWSVTMHIWHEIDPDNYEDSNSHIDPETLPDISGLWGKYIQFRDMQARLTNINYDGENLTADFSVLYEGSDPEYYAPAFLRLAILEHDNVIDQEKCEWKYVPEADSFTHTCRYTVPVKLEPGKSYAVSVAYFNPDHDGPDGSSTQGIETDKQLYRYVCKPTLTFWLNDVPDNSDTSPYFENFAEAGAAYGYELLDFGVGERIYTAKLYGCDIIQSSKYVGADYSESGIVPTIIGTQDSGSEIPELVTQTVLIADTHEDRINGLKKMNGFDPDKLEHSSYFSENLGMTVDMYYGREDNRQGSINTSDLWALALIDDGNVLYVLSFENVAGLKDVEYAAGRITDTSARIGWYDGEEALSILKQYAGEDYSLPLAELRKDVINYRTHDARTGESLRTDYRFNIPADEGEPLYAVTGGKVIETASVNVPGNAEGIYLTLQAPDGRKWRYSHLSDIYVSEGDTVKAGDRIAAVGSTGWCT